MMGYPRYVFKNGGPHERAGGSYNSVIVADEAEYGAAIKAGWFGNLQEAIDAPKVEQVESSINEPEPVGPADDAPPTREELEAKAADLGIKFHHKIGDAKLAGLIAKALEG